MFDLWVSESMGRHGTVGGGIRIIIFIEFHGCCKSFNLFDDLVCVFRIIFSDKSLDSGGIKDCHIGFGRVNGLADRFSKVNKAAENGLQIKKEVLFETGDFGSIGGLC